MKLILGLILCLTAFLCDAKRTNGEDLKTGADGAKEYMLRHNKLPARTPTQNELRKKIPPPINFDTCGECKLVIGRLSAVLNDPQKLAQLKAEFKLLCDMVPAAYQAECRDVADNLDTIAEELGPYIKNPAKFCQEIHLCKGEAWIGEVARFPLLYAKKFLNRVEGRSNDMLCDECQLAVDELRTLLTDKAIQAEIKDVLDKICSVLPGSYKQECDDLVNTWWPAILEEIEQVLKDSKALCTDLGLCSSATVSFRAFPLFPSRHGRHHHHRSRTPNLDSFKHMLTRLQTKNGFKIACVMCKYGFTAFLDELKTNPQILSRVADGLVNVCKVFPDSYQPGCVDFLRIYLVPVMQVTLAQLTPTEICDDMHICDGHDLRILRKTSGKVRNEIICDACKGLAEFLKYELQQKEFQEELTEAVKEVCDIVPGSMAQDCDNLVDQYVPYVLSELVEFLDPDVVCPDLHLCPSSVSRRIADPEEENNEAENIPEVLLW